VTSPVHALARTSLFAFRDLIFFFVYFCFVHLGHVHSAE
jgi:hypothetical protein